MTDARIGRLLVAVLHQAISEALPGRLDFYEHWLTGEGLRDGTIGLAPMIAVLGFLRTEGAGPYDAVMMTAGTYAADWTVDAMSVLRRRWIGALPKSLRARAALRIARDAVRAGYPSARISATARRGQLRFQVQDSLFCRVRERRSTPLCGYHRALVVKTLQRFGLSVDSETETCIATGAETCLITMSLG